jgi:hypothetical protein
MRIQLFEPPRVSRRRMLSTAFASVCGVATYATGLPTLANAAGSESTQMKPTDLITALRSIGTPGCLAAADRLEASTGSQAGFDLHLRRAGLNQADAQVLADGMLRAHAGNALSLRSFSASYNPELGDVGAATLATAFPATMTELGLVGCSVGDAGARPILEWARSAPNLKMICVEGNNFSAGMKTQFRDLASLGRNMLVVV